MEFKEYISILSGLFCKIDSKEVENCIKAIEKAYKDDKQIFFFGNGGSAANSSHFCEDLGKGLISDPNNQKRIRAISLTDNVPYILAWANDTNYDRIFVEQLKNLANPGDLVIGISGSGNSQNVVQSIEYANNNGINSFCFTGYDGGILKKISQQCVHIDSFNMGAVETAHQAVIHYIIDVLYEKYKLSGSNNM